MRSLLATAFAWLAKTPPRAIRVAPATAPRARWHTVAWLSANALSLVALAHAWQRSGAEIARAALPSPIPADTPTTRFGLREETRRSIFFELATAELQERRRAELQNTWGGHAWSRDDDLGAVLRGRAREIAQRDRVSLTQIYLVFDEGIRSRWPSPNGAPLPATVAPLSWRRE